MSPSPQAQITPVRVATPGEMKMAGISGEFTGPKGIAELWEKFLPYLDKLPVQVGNVAWGVIFGSDANGKFKYMPAVQVSDFSSLPAELEQVTIPAQDYHVFAHGGNLDQLPDTIGQICRTGVFHAPLSADQVGMMEYYGPGFDPMTGTGDMEVWVPSRS